MSVERERKEGKNSSRRKERKKAMYYLMINGSILSEKETATSGEWREKKYVKGGHSLRITWLTSVPCELLSYR